MESIVDLDALSLSRAIHAREVSCREVMQASLARIELLNPVVNALVSLREPEDCLRDADQADSELANGASRGWMHGFPQAPKDLTPVAGMVTTRGSLIFKGRVTLHDSLGISRMRRSGSIFIGRSNAPEFGLGSHTYNSVYGLTNNAFDPSRTAGGSSGGAAVAVALRMLPLADGSDMMGSLRNPAAYNNIFGMRPSFGRIPAAPADEIFLHQFSTTGPLARSVEDLAMLLSVQAGADSRAPFALQDSPAQFAAPLVAREAKGTRIGWLGDFDAHLAIEPSVLEACTGALEHFRAIGCDVDLARTDFDMRRVWNAWTTLRSFAVAGTNSALYKDEASRALLKPEAVWEIERGMALSAMDVHQASVGRSAWYQAVGRLFERFDFLVLPSAQLFPFDARLDWPKSIAGRPMDTYHRWMEVVVPAALAGLPALSVPAGFNKEGLPIGLQIIGPPRSDRAVLELGCAYQYASDYHARLSPLLGTENGIGNALASGKDDA